MRRRCSVTISGGKQNRKLKSAILMWGRFRQIQWFWKLSKSLETHWKSKLNFFVCWKCQHVFFFCIIHVFGYLDIFYWKEISICSFHFKLHPHVLLLFLGTLAFLSSLFFFLSFLKIIDFTYFTSNFCFFFSTFILAWDEQGSC